MAKNLLKVILFGTALAGLGYNCTCDKKEEPKYDAIVKKPVSDYFPEVKFPSDGKKVIIKHDLDGKGDLDLIVATDCPSMKCLADVHFFLSYGEERYHENK